MPALTAAQDALNVLTKKDMSELKAYSKPPALVELCLKGVMTVLKKSPTWDAAKKALDQAKQNAATATGESKAALQAEAKAAQNAFDVADKAAKSVAAKSSRAEKARAQVQQIAKAAAAKAVE